MSGFTVAEDRIGRLGPLGSNAVPSDIDKLPAAGPLMVRAEGFDGDQHGDPAIIAAPTRRCMPIPRRIAEARLARRTVEDWRPRLDSPG